MQPTANACGGSWPTSFGICKPGLPPSNVFAPWAHTVPHPTGFTARKAAKKTLNDGDSLGCHAKPGREPSRFPFAASELRVRPSPSRETFLNRKRASTGQRDTGNVGVRSSDQNPVSHPTWSATIQRRTRQRTPRDRNRIPQASRADYSGPAPKPGGRQTRRSSWTDRSTADRRQGGGWG